MSQVFAPKARRFGLHQLSRTRKIIRELPRSVFKINTNRNDHHSHHEESSLNTRFITELSNNFGNVLSLNGGFDYLPVLTWRSQIERELKIKRWHFIQVYLTDYHACISSSA